MTSELFAKQTRANSMKTTLRLVNPKRFPELLLFFGIVLVLMGSGIEAITTNPTLANDGWIVVIVSIFLWVLREFKTKI